MRALQIRFFFDSLVYFNEIEKPRSFVLHHVEINDRATKERAWKFARSELRLSPWAIPSCDPASLNFMAICGGEKFARRLEFITTGASSVRTIANYAESNICVFATGLINRGSNRGGDRCGIETRGIKTASRNARFAMRRQMLLLLANIYVESRCCPRCVNADVCVVARSRTSFSSWHIADQHIRARAGFCAGCCGDSVREASSYRRFNLKHSSKYLRISKLRLVEANVWTFNRILRGNLNVNPRNVQIYTEVRSQDEEDVWNCANFSRDNSTAFRRTWK